MSDKDYKVRRITTTFTVIMLILLLFSMLSFFGVIEFGDYFVSEYCELPSVFECEDLEVRTKEISFTLRNGGEELENIKIETSSKDCAPYERNTVARGSKFKVTISCTQTAAVGKPFKDKLEFTYKPALKLKSLEGTGRVKAVVKAKI